MALVASENAIGAGEHSPMAPLAPRGLVFSLHDWTRPRHFAGVDWRSPRVGFRRGGAKPIGLLPNRRWAIAEDRGPATIDLMPARGFVAYGAGCAASSPAPLPPLVAQGSIGPNDPRLVLPSLSAGAPHHFAAINSPRSRTSSPKLAAPTQRNLGTLQAWEGRRELSVSVGLPPTIIVMKFQLAAPQTP